MAEVSVLFSGEDVRLLPLLDAVVALDLIGGAEVLDPRLLAVDVRGLGLRYTALQEVIDDPEQNGLQNITVTITISWNKDTNKSDQTNNSELHRQEICITLRQ